MENPLVISLFIEKGQEGSYITRSFTVPPQTESLHLVLRYERDQERAAGENASSPFVTRRRTSNIDLGLLSPGGRQAGYSGSERGEVFISETGATPGYTPQPLLQGEWHLLLGAHRVAPAGVRVSCELTFTAKHLRLLKGDLHAHTLASDGVHTAEELGHKAVRHGLQFLAVTDHNLVSSRASLPWIPGLTMVPGVEWTHYRGHASFLGIDEPWDTPFFVDTPGGVRERFQAARDRGAFISVNHPFEPGCEFRFDLASLPFDCLEAWNGPMREPNLRALGLWQGMLQAGRRIAVCGGSDYHRDTPFIFLGGPTTCVHSLSAGTSDILDALKRGHSYLAFSPKGPTLDLAAGEAIVGDSVAWSEVRELRIKAGSLAKGDVIRVVTDKGAATLFTAPEDGDIDVPFVMDAPGFARVEILRAFIPWVPLLPAALSNPIYFEPSTRIPAPSR